jgi:hypothetical protein
LHQLLGFLTPDTFQVNVKTDSGPFSVTWLLREMDYIFRCWNLNGLWWGSLCLRTLVQWFAGCNEGD